MVFRRGRGHPHRPSVQGALEIHVRRQAGAVLPGFRIQRIPKDAAVVGGPGLRRADRLENKRFGSRHNPQLQNGAERHVPGESHLSARDRSRIFGRMPRRCASAELGRKLRIAETPTRRRASSIRTRSDCSALSPLSSSCSGQSEGIQEAHSRHLTEPPVKTPPEDCRVPPSANPTLRPLPFCHPCEREDPVSLSWRTEGKETTLDPRSSRG